MSKQRRIIFNDDGAAEKPSHNPEATAEGFLAAYFNSAVGSQVDSWFYSVGKGSLTEEGELYPWGEKRQTAGVFGDANQLIIEAARPAEMEIFVSLRMNDIHDSFIGIEERLKLQRPDLLIGEEYWPGAYPHLLNGEEPVARQAQYPPDPIMAYYYSAFDYAKPEVRQYRLDFIRKMCREYDWDGLELDFMRHPLFFKLGEEEENLATMTEFVRQVRALLAEIGQERGRPYLLAVRVPPTPELALQTGLDVEQWLAEGCIDLLIVGSEWCCYGTELEDFVEMGHKQGVLVYLNCPTPTDPAQSHNLSGEVGGPVVRAISSNFWALGADGIYLFNYPYVDKDMVAQWLNQIGGPDTLLGLDKLYLPEGRGSSWDKTPGQGAYVTVLDAFPMHLIHGPTIEIMVGDDLAEAVREGLLQEIRFQVGVENMHEVEGISIKLNGTRIPAADIERTAEDLFEVVLQTPPVEQGINQIQLLPGLHCIGRAASVVTGLKLWVRYKALSALQQPHREGMAGAGRAP